MNVYKDQRHCEYQSKFLFFNSDLHLEVHFGIVRLSQANIFIKISLLKIWKRYICESLGCQARYESGGNKVPFDGGKLKNKQWKWPGCSFYSCHKQSWIDMVGCYFKKGRGQNCFQFHQQPQSAWACLEQVTRGKWPLISRISEVLSTSEQLTETVLGNYVVDAIFYSVLSKMKSETFVALYYTDTLQVVPISDMTSREVHCWQPLPGSWSDGTSKQKIWLSYNLKTKKGGQGAVCLVRCKNPSLLKPEAVSAMNLISLISSILFSRFACLL